MVVQSRSPAVFSHDLSVRYPVYFPSGDGLLEPARKMSQATPKHLLQTFESGTGEGPQCAHSGPSHHCVTAYCPRHTGTSGVSDFFTGFWANWGKASEFFTTIKFA